ncbi:MAG: DUF4255 domain-containing protein [Chloroflexi bacterium]|nr:MAG: DUF4255 domain-containing protein [Chloroflexota bacterium]
MATFKAITAVSKAIISLLQVNYEQLAPETFSNPLQFNVYTAKDFSKPLTNGISLYLYRIFPGGSRRSPAGRTSTNGQKFQTQLPLDLHFLLTVWANKASVQQSVAGWMMRVLEDTPILPFGLLEKEVPGAFRSNETVEIYLSDLSTDDLLHLWETLPVENYQLSIPYFVRNIYIESEQLIPPTIPVQTRTFVYQKNEND